MYVYIYKYIYIYIHCIYTLHICIHRESVVTPTVHLKLVGVLSVGILSIGVLSCTVSIYAVMSKGTHK